MCWVQLHGWGSGFFVGSGQIKVKGLRFPSDSKEADACILALDCPQD